MPLNRRLTHMLLRNAKPEREQLASKESQLSTSKRSVAKTCQLLCKTEKSSAALVTDAVAEEQQLRTALKRGDFKTIKL